MARMNRPMMAMYSKIMDSTLGILHFTNRLTSGFNKKYRNPEMMIGKNSVDTKIPTGSNKKEIIDDT